MAYKYHTAVTTSDIHTLHFDEHANQAARLADTFVAADVNKITKQTDDSSFWRVTAAGSPGTTVPFIPPPPTVSDIGKTLVVASDGASGVKWVYQTGGGGGGGTLDDAYNADSGTRTITVDAGDVEWDLSGAYSFVVDLTAATGSVDGFLVENGTDYFRVLYTGANSATFNAELATATIQSSGSFTVSATGGTSDLTLGGRGATITLNQSGDTTLSGFTATSIIGALNEVKAGTSGLWTQAGGALYPTTASDLVTVIGGGASTGYKVDSLTFGYETTGGTGWIQSAGAAAVSQLDINPEGGLVSVSGESSSHSVTDGIVTSGLECNSPSYFDGALNMYSNSTLDENAALFMGVVNNGWPCLLGNNATNRAGVLGTGSASNTWLILSTSNRILDYSISAESNPTLKGFSATASGTATDQWWSKTHNSTDAVNGIGKGGQVTEHEVPVTLADDGSFDLPSASAGMAKIVVGDNVEYAWFTWETDGTVSLLINSSNVVSTDTDTKFCIFDNGTSVRVRNRLGASRTVMFKYDYTTSPV